MTILLMTRPMALSKSFVSGLSTDARRDLEVIYAPLIQIVPTEIAPVLDDIAGVIFTSSNAVAFAPKGADRPAYCVGHRTAAQATAQGWDVKLTALNAAELVEKMLKSPQQGRLVHLAGEHRRGDIDGRLTKAGLSTTVHVLYTQPLLPLTVRARQALTGERPVIVPLFSPRAAAQFVSQAPLSPVVQVLAMSGAVADALGGAYGDQVQIAASPTGKDMVRGIENMTGGNSLP